MDLVAAITAEDPAALAELANARDEHGVSALLLSLYHRRPAARDALLEAGANPNVAQRSGHTPLDAARHHQDAELERLLTDYGAQPVK